MAEKIPEARTETLRKEITELLSHSEKTIGEISKIVRKQEREVIAHLEHIAKKTALVITPAECLKCGFVFNERTKIKKPSKCPACKNTYIDEPLFYISN